MADIVERLMALHEEALTAAGSAAASYERSGFVEFAQRFEKEEEKATAALRAELERLFDVEKMLAECVPGGSLCDPQHVADAIRTYYNAWQPAADAMTQMVRSGEALQRLIDGDEQPAADAPVKAIAKLLNDAMALAVANGANSVSMPDELVEIAAWLHRQPEQPAADAQMVLVPREPTEAMLDAYLRANNEYWQAVDVLPRSRITTTWRSGTPRDATRVSYIAMIAAAKEAK